MFYVDEEEMGIPDNEHKMYESKETAEFFFFFPQKNASSCIWFNQKLWIGEFLENHSRSIL